MALLAKTHSSVLSTAASSCTDHALRDPSVHRLRSHGSDGPQRRFEREVTEADEVQLTNPMKLKGPKTPSPSQNHLLGHPTPRPDPMSFEGQTH
eukprot:CAMPEP_0114560302 /NCGR_PEP_ID=MMETSP0114-20121206/11387_1 /TAXON_ID=31324 /ORGANISM="Goniomonas sp, Strain m" /LENGTH=93 /DNA_ID=CAMNT_0001745839 /DNA_START=103 /DNA_END=381 /DNA_ORIENTATION=-